MNLFEAVSIIEEGIPESDGDENIILSAWQWLIDSGYAWTLQGWYGRTATYLIESGACSAPGVQS